jgi:hypothetical protein
LEELHAELCAGGFVELDSVKLVFVKLQRLEAEDLSFPAGPTTKMTVILAAPRVIDALNLRSRTLPVTTLTNPPFRVLKPSFRS